MRLRIHTDGGSRGNPGPAAIGVVGFDGETVLFEIQEFIGVTTNNVAEYTAVKRAFTHMFTISTKIEETQFFLDSQLVVEQLNGRFAVKHPNMIELKKEIDALRVKLPFPVSFTYVPRSQNTHADRLVNIALDNQA